MLTGLIKALLLAEAEIYRDFVGFTWWDPMERSKGRAPL